MRDIRVSDITMREAIASKALSYPSRKSWKS